MDATEFQLHAQLEDRHWWFRARRQILAGLIERYASLPDGSRLLEIGCGTGGNLRHFGQKYTVEGIEPDSTAARIAQATTPCPIHTAAVEDIQRTDIQTPDAILMADVLEHIDNDRSALKAALELLPLNGLLIVTVPADPALWSPHDEVLGHKRRYTSKTLEALYSDLPCHSRYQSYFNTLLYPAIRFTRCIGKKETRHGSDLQQHHPIINALLYRVFSTEAHLLKHMRLGIGCSLVTLLEKH